MYNYLKETYGKAPVKAIFDGLELDKTRKIPIEGQRYQGSTTFICLVYTLERYINHRKMKFILPNFTDEEIRKIPLEDRIHIDAPGHILQTVYLPLLEKMKDLVYSVNGVRASLFTGDGELIEEISSNSTQSHGRGNVSNRDHKGNRPMYIVVGLNRPIDELSSLEQGWVDDLQYIASPEGLVHCYLDREV